jgi:hypothetical protein
MAESTDMPPTSEHITNDVKNATNGDPYGVTLLRSMGPRLAKRIAADRRIDGNEKAKHFSVSHESCRDLPAIRDLLLRIGPDPRTGMVRGELTDADSAKYTTRDNVSFREVPRCVLALDADDADTVDEVISSLPPAFHGVSYVRQWTGSYGFKSGARCRLFYILASPLTGPQVYRWLTESGALVDFSVFQRVQLIYMAFPVLAPGVADPAEGERVEIVEGDWSEVPVPDEVLALPAEPATDGTGDPIATTCTPQVREAVLAHLRTREYPKRHAGIGSWIGDAILAGLGSEEIASAAGERLGELDSERSPREIEGEVNRLMEHQQRKAVEGSLHLSPWAEAIVDPYAVAADMALPDLPAVDGIDAEVTASGLHVVAAAALVAAHPSYKTPIVDGLLREGETMNIIAAPKIGKSWLALLLVFCIANGVPFLGRRCAKGGVLILDNELHPETAAQRLRVLAAATGLSLDGIHLMSLRGQLEDLPRLAKRIVDAALSVGAKVIVLDALYRLLPASTSENDNAGMMQLYNCIDRIARDCGAAIVCIHHSSKGNQGEKSITDGGAGAGSIARAADCHLFLREHEDLGRVVVDAVARSWPPPASIVIERPALVWQVAVGADASRVKGRAVQRGVNVAADDVLQYVAAKPEPIVALMARLETANIRASRSRVEGVLALAVNDGRVVCETGPRNAKLYGREASIDSVGGTQVDRVRRYRSEHPQATQAEIAAAINCDARTVRRATGAS